MNTMNLMRQLPTPDHFEPMPFPVGDQEACLRTAAEITEQKIDIEALTGHPIEIRLAGDRGHGVFAKRHFEPGEVVLSSEIYRVVPGRTRTSFELAPGGKHAELMWPAWRINHSCEPNCGIRDNAVGAYDFIAGPDGIAAGEEILTHYGMHEWFSTAVGECRCGAATCAGRSLGWGELTPSLRTIFAEGYGVARHLTDPGTVRGLVVGIELWGARSPESNADVTRFVNRLAEHLGVICIGQPEIRDFGDGILAGWTWTQMIAASSLTGHHYRETGQAWIDLVTCRPCHAESVARWCAETWSAGGFNVTVTERS